MPFKYDLSDELEETMRQLFKRDKTRYEITWKKIAEITSRNAETVEFYKNMRHGLKGCKRVHIDKNFVLLFKVFKAENFILFDKLEHHDRAYK